MKKIVYGLTLISINAFSYATLLSDDSLEDFYRYRERINYKNAVDKMSDDELREKSRNVKQKLLDLYNKLYSLPNLHYNTFSDLCFKNKIREKNTHKHKEKCREYFELSGNLYDLSYHLRCILEKKNKNIENNYLLKIGDSFFGMTAYGDTENSKPSTPVKAIQKIVRKEIWQQEYKKYVLKSDVQKNKALFEKMFSNTKKLYKKFRLYPFLTYEKMKTAKFCANWYESKGNTITPNSNRKLVKWSKFCKSCSNYLKKNKL